MKVYGNLMNRIIEEVGSPVPVVGMGATVYMFSDRTAHTVIAVSGTTRATIQEDKATRTDKNGMSENQDYEFAPDPNGPTHDVRKCKDGSWKLKGGGSVVRFGQRDKYYDFGF